MAARLLLGVLFAALGAVLLLHGAQHCRRGLARKVLGPTGGGSPAASCDNLACPPYRAVHSESDFEIREYSPAKWAQTEPLLDASFTKATGRGFRSLFQYIQGANEGGVQIPMTAPVLTAITPSGGPFCSSAFAVRFFVPPQFQGSPPAPDQSLGVSVASLPRRCVAARRFPGFATDYNVAQEAKQLADSLASTPWANITRMGGAEGGEVYGIAQYNSPFELLNRVNEVWVPFSSVEGKDDCTPAASVGHTALALQ